jgi:hypothetical protein
MKNKFWVIMLVFILALSFTACGDSSKHEGEAKTPSASSTQKGRDYQDVVDKFKEKGFTNIKTEALEDLVTGWMTKDGEVESVSVDGDGDYSADVWYPSDVQVIITYHTFSKESSDSTEQKPDKTSSDIKPPYDNNSINGLDYEDVVESFKNAGFTKISVEKRFEAEFLGYEADKVANIYINGSGTFNTDSTYAPDSEVRIDYYVISKPDPKSDTELTKFYAQTAFENYAEKQYPSGIKCHWVADLLNAEQNSDGSWFFKVGVTITNQNGKEQDAVAEGVISGTDKEPKVDQFYVSN